MNFEVVGFYKSDFEFSMAAAAALKVSVDYSIVMPYFIPLYDPVDEDGILTRSIHIAEINSGYIAISEPVEEIDDDTYARYMNIVDEIAERHGLSGVYTSPLWPVGFVFPYS